MHFAKIHKINVLWGDSVCKHVCSYVSSSKPVNKFRLNWILGVCTETCFENLISVRIGSLQSKPYESEITLLNFLVFRLLCINLINIRLNERCKFANILFGYYEHSNWSALFNSVCVFIHLCKIPSTLLPTWFLMSLKIARVCSKTT